MSQNDFKTSEIIQQQGMRHLVERRGKNRTAVAVANKHARIVWALLTSHQNYQPATS